MRWVPLKIILLIGTVICVEEGNNEVVIGTSIKPPINLDSNLRKALLKALIELENDDKENYDRNTRNDYVNIITHLDNTNKNVEKASASAVSYFTKSEPVNMTITVKKSISKPKQTVVQKSRVSQKKTIHDNDDLDASESPEHFVASASSSFTSRKVKTGNIGDSKSSSAPLVNSLTSRVKVNKEQATTAKPTTSTEESEANVESLQFFSAPLVAAFTVHQDEKGLPKSVVPIYNQPAVLTGTTAKHLEKEKKLRDGAKQDTFKHDLVTRHEEELRQRQKKLEEEIRRLTKLQEEQERIIREQKLAYEQKIFEQQKKLFAEQTRLFNNNVQPFVPIITTTPKPTFQPSNQETHNENLRNSGGTLVSVQPSFGFVQTPAGNDPFSPNAQVLPIKNAIDFRSPFAPNFKQFRDQNSVITNSQPTFLSRPLNTGVSLGFNIQNSPSVNTIRKPLVAFRNTVQNHHDLFQSLPSVEKKTVFREKPSFVQTFTSQNLPFASITPTFRVAEIIPQQQGSRSLRQETGTGNFLNNNIQNSPAGNSNLFVDHRFNRNPLTSVALSKPLEFTSPNSFRFINTATVSPYNTLQYSADEPFVNQRLNNLLYFSGLGQGRQHEDLNIVSKVLSLNHLGNGDSNFATSNVDSRRIRPPTSWRVV